MPSADTAHPIEKHSHILVPFTRGRGISIGFGGYRPWPHFTTVDRKPRLTPSDPVSTRMLAEQGWPNLQPDLVVKNWEEAATGFFTDHSLDFVVADVPGQDELDLKHLAKAVPGFLTMLKRGGHLILAEPCPPKGTGVYPQSMGIENAIKDLSNLLFLRPRFKIVDPEWKKRLMVWQVETNTGENEPIVPLHDGKPFSDEACLVIRYGTIGDCIQCDSVISALAAKGHEVWMNTSEIGFEVLQKHPDITGWWLQDQNQVPMPMLPEYWGRLSRLFPRVVNLNECIETTLLLMPGTRRYILPHKARHRLCDHNYVEFMHEIAEVEDCPATPIFRSDAQETEKVFEKTGHVHLNRPSLGIALAGSSIHKMYPHYGELITKLLIETNFHIFFLGDKACSVLEHAIEQVVAYNLLGLDHHASHRMARRQLRDKIHAKLSGDDPGHERLFPLSGKLSIRESLVLAQHLMVMVGPETGLLNSVAFNRNVRKLVMLSHSSHENLTRDWLETAVITPEDLHCYPCHRMHYEKITCNIDEETGASLCTAGIPPKQMFEKIIDGPEVVP